MQNYMKNHMKIFWFSIFHPKFLWEQNHCVLGAIKMDGFIKVYDGTRYVVLFGSERYDAIYDRIRCLISQKNGIMYSIKHSFARIGIDSYNSLPIEKTLAFHNVIILTKSLFYKNENH